MKKKNVFKILTIFLTFAFLFQFLIFGVKPAKSSAEAEYRPSTAMAFTLNQNEDEKYVISSMNDLNSFTKSVNSGETTRGKTFVVIAPISVDSSFVSIGTSSYPFRGTFEGANNNCYLSNLGKPLFYKTDGATIKNVEIASGSIIINNTYVGALVSYAVNTNIVQCRNVATVSNTSTSGTIYTGGLVGYSSSGSIEQCSNMAKVSNSSSLVAESYVGGIVGYSNYTYITDCYCLGTSSSSQLQITALAKRIEANSVVRKSGDSLYYSMLETINEKAQKALEDARNVLNSKQNETNALRREINNAKAWIASQENYIAQLTQEANDSWWGCKWVYIGPQIAGIYTAIGARWAEIGVLEASLKVAEGAVWVAQQAVDLALKTASKTVYDMQWVNPYQDCTKKLEDVYAYAYGIGYSNTSVYNCYTANIETTGGYEKTFYAYYLQFWAQSVSQEILLSSEQIERHFSFVNSDRYGYITNASAYNCFTLNNTTYNRDIEFGSPDGSDLITEHDTFGSFGKQKLIFEERNNYLTIYVANRYGSAKTQLNSFTFDKPLENVQGNSCNGQKATLTNNIKNQFNDKVWGYGDSSIENGYPHLKYRYWQYSISEN